MLKNYFKIALRNLVKNKVYSFINIGGLAVGMAICLLINLYIFDELSYDKQFENVEQLYRVGTLAKDEKWTSVSAPVAQGLKKDFAEVEQVARFLKFPNMDKMLLKNTKLNKQFYEDNGYYVDDTFFEIFSYQSKYGSLKNALTEPNSIVISENVASKMFGNENPLNKTISVEIPYGKTDFIVKGIFDENQQKSHINAHFFLSMENNDIGQWAKSQTSWSNNSIFHTYLKLKKGADAVKFEAKLDDFFQRNGGADLKAAGVSKSLFLQPVKDIYLKSSFGNEIAANGSMTYIYIFGSIAVFLLLIACINFMNLSTARAEKRAKEVGIRKAIGAVKSGLVAQFLSESLIMCLISLCFALGLVKLFLPLFNQFTLKDLSLFQNSNSLLWIPGIALITGLLAGLYPSFYLASFKPIEVLKGRLINRISAVAIRKGLVVFQFAISISLIFAVVIIWQQMNLVRNQDLGFNKNQQIILPLQSTTSANNVGVLKNELLKITDVKAITSGTSYPGIQLIEDQMFYAEGKTQNENVDIHYVRANEDYSATLGYKTLFGRELSNNPQADSSAIVLNESAVKKLGFDVKNAIGKKIYYAWNNKVLSREIVGVIKDFNYRSLHEAISPFGLVKLNDGDQASYLIANVKTSNYKNIIGAFEIIWKHTNPETPFEYTFLDQEFQRNYEKEERTAGIIIYFTLIAIVIACLGLFGLATFTAEQRTKEIGIRKVLGASVISITQLLSIDFLKLVFIACLLALPLGYWIMTKWLQDFAYKIDVSWWIFALSGFVAIIIALLTVSYQAIKAALMNPVKSLKTE
ncbi:FtsX-like permease family protein [Emticicia sp. SJ17W-69]|uniref:ABC transporter permease n=1 Tax=Emticicia sp. SJ17W-69 TaxID=3421657 RepID=UPI003EB91852